MIHVGCIQASTANQIRLRNIDNSVFVGTCPNKDLVTILCRLLKIKDMLISLNTWNKTKQKHTRLETAMYCKTKQKL